jgi:3-oxoadipate enol-lactonase/2-succinyl-6-hydroxy-2,4-cyclohexadiene-1-carboxylate synthase
VDYLKLARFHLIGLSMGGATAIGYALEHQSRLISLTLASTGAAGYSVSKKFERLDRVARREGINLARRKWMDWSLAWYKDKHHDVGRFIKAMMDDYTGAAWADPMRGRYPRESDLERIHRITCPTLILVGELDKVFTTLARKIHSRIGGSILNVYAQTGHMLNLEAPDRFNRDLGEFIQTAEQA